MSGNKRKSERTESDSGCERTRKQALKSNLLIDFIICMVNGDIINIWMLKRLIVSNSLITNHYCFAMNGQNIRIIHYNTVKFQSRKMKCHSPKKILELWTKQHSFTNKTKFWLFSCTQICCFNTKQK